MKFDRIRIRAFGPLRDLDTGADPLPSMVVVQAPNEGGKSSFFVALSSLLYGFYPAGRDRHPYAPWSGEDADLEAEITRRDAGSLVVHRRLLSSPWGRITRHDTDTRITGEKETGSPAPASAPEDANAPEGGSVVSRRATGEVTDLANRTLPFVSHVRRELFGDVFALTLGDLARIDDESWEEIQDRLLGAMGAEDLRSSRAVVQELDAAADSLWRSDRRGKPEARLLQKRLEELDGDRREARDRDREIRATARRLEELRESLESTRRRRLEAEAILERAQTLGPVRSRLLRIRESEELAGDLEELSDLPARPDERLRELKAELDSRKDEMATLEVREEELEKRANSVTKTDRRLLERATEVRALGKMAGEVQVARRRLPALEERLVSLERRCADVARQLFSEPWEDVSTRRVREISVGELRSRIRGYRDRREDARQVEARAAAEREQDRRRYTGRLRRLLSVMGRLLLGAVAVGAVLVILGSATEAEIWALVGGVILVNAGVLWLGLQTVRLFVLEGDEEAPPDEADDPRERARAVRREEEAALESVAEALTGLPIISGLLEDPDPEIAHLMGELQGHLESQEEVRRERESLEELLDDAGHRLDAVTGALGMDLPEGFLVAVATLEARLDEAADRERDARAAVESLEDLRESLERLRKAKEEEEGRLEKLRDRLSGLGGGDLGRGVARASERMEARERARTLRKELRRQHPDLDDLRRRIREAEEDGEEWTTDEEARIRARDRYRDLNEREKELISEIREQEARIRELESRTTLDRIEGEILHLREELGRVRRRRDRLALLSGLVRAADHRFRERNQPDVLRTAGRHLDTITGGRYRRLLMEEGELSGTLYLEGPGYPHPVEVDAPVSTGTREQVYLALRLAIIDHLDAGGERLPLFLDEAFVNWDADRRERAFGLLGTLARERQIFVFTCHEPMAGELEKEGARRIRLDGPE